MLRSLGEARVPVFDGIWSRGMRRMRLKLSGKSASKVSETYRKVLTKWRARAVVSAEVFGGGPVGVCVCGLRGCALPVLLRRCESAALVLASGNKV